MLDDGRPESARAMSLCRRALNDFPNFAPFYLILGDLHRDRGDADRRTGELSSWALNLSKKPGFGKSLSVVLSLVLCQRKAARDRNHVARANNVNGSLVAHASARLDEFEREGKIDGWKRIMTILFLHGWTSVPGGVKPTYLKDHGHTVINPKLPDEDFAEAVRIASVAEFDKHRPQVAVGSSRAGPWG